MSAVAAHGDVDIVAEEATERDVPAAPKLGDGATDVGVVEVFVEMETQAPSHADGHVGIAGEVKIDLEGEGQNADPCAGGGEVVERTAKKLIDDFGKLVGEEHFLGQTDEEAVSPFGKIVGADAAVADFFGHGAVAHDGAGYQLREHGDVEQQTTETILSRSLLPVHVDEVGHGLKGVETDADGEGYAGSGHRNAPRIEGVREEVGILERTDGGKIAEDAEKEEKAGDGTAVDDDAHEVVEDHAAQHEKDVDGFSPSIEDEGENDENVVLIRLLWTVE